MLKGGSLIIDREDLTRSLRRWRSLFFLLLAISLLLFFDPELQKNTNNTHIARIAITGFIDINQEEIAALNKLAEDEKVKAVIIDIDSGGGTVVGGEYYYYAVKNLAAKKPVITYFGNQATSAAYMVAMASDYIISPEGAITGSVGVIAQSAELSGLAEKLGINPIIVKSTPLKATPHPAEKLTEEGLKEMQIVVGDLYSFFMRILLENRDNLNKEQIASIASGKIFTGRQALAVGLVDEIGEFSKVENWLKNRLKITELNIIRRELIKSDDFNLLDYVRSLLLGKKRSAYNLPAMVSYWPQN